jgi:GMC oxidoreductase
MKYVRGNPRDYDEWRDMGCEGWGWDDLLPYFIRAEDSERGTSEFHGSGGSLPVSMAQARNAIEQAFIDAAVADGLPASDDFNGPDQDGVGWYDFTYRDGRRASTAACYLHPAAERPNLTIETRAHALGILFEGTRAVGVSGIWQYGPVELRADREVIVCAGAYGSPQLLMLSGIGRPDELVRLRIEPVAELPGVGLNLQDHPLAGATYLSDRADTLFDAFNEANLELLEQGQGPLAGAGSEAGAFVRTREGLDAPDLQLLTLPALWCRRGSYRDTRPASRSGRRRSSRRAAARWRWSHDPTAKPLIVHDYFAEPEDMRVQIEGVRLALEIARTEPLAECLGEPHLARHRTPTRTSSSTSERMRRRSTTRSARAGWASTSSPSWIPSCACAASRRCGWWTPRSCRCNRGPTRTRRQSRSPRRRLISSAAALHRAVGSPRRTERSDSPSRPPSWSLSEVKRYGLPHRDEQQTRASTRSALSPVLQLWKGAAKRRSGDALTTQRRRARGHFPRGTDALGSERPGRGWPAGTFQLGADVAPEAAFSGANSR